MRLLKPAASMITASAVQTITGRAVAPTRAGPSGFQASCVEGAAVLCVRACGDVGGRINGGFG